VRTIPRTGRSYFMPVLRSWKTSCKLSTKLPYKNSVLPGALADWHPHPIQCMLTTLLDTRTCTANLYCIYSIYTFLYSIHILLCNIFIYTVIKM
jgi:hypothetical protein